MITIQLWCNGTYKGYRQISIGFFERLKKSMKSGLLKNADIQYVEVKERKQ